MTEKARFDILLVLPAIPDEEDACAHRLSEIVLDHEGVEKAHIREGKSGVPGQFCVHFDPNRISLRKLRSLVQAAGAKLDQRYGHLVLKNAPMHARQTRTIKSRIQAIPGVIDSGVSVDGVIRIEFDKQNANENSILAAIASLGITTELLSRYPQSNLVDQHQEKAESTEQTDQDVHSHGHGGLFGEQTELVFAILCGVFLLAGWILSMTMNLPAWTVLSFYLVSYFFGGYFTLIETLKKLRLGQFEIDFLMLVAAIGAAILGHWSEGALLLFLFSISHSLEHYAMGRARRAIEALSNLAPDTAIVRRNGSIEELPVGELIVGDHVIVKPNERVAADGFVIKGESSVDQSPITGESLPVDKRPVGNREHAANNENSIPAEHRVFAGTINQSGSMEIQVTRLATESTLARVVTMVNEAETQQSTTQRFAERFERVFVPTVLFGVGLLLFAWIVVNEPFSASFYRAMAVLVAASPCALAISTPSAVLSGVARAARGGVLIKGGAPLQDLGRVDAIAFDKTGTLTEGHPHLTDVIATEDSNEDQILRTAIAVESLSDHPLATAIVREGKSRLAAHGHAADLEITPAENLRSITGRGVSAKIDVQDVFIGKRHLFAEIDGRPLPLLLIETIDQLEANGRTTMIVRLGDRYLGVLGVMDTPRETAKETIQQLRSMGVGRMIMISGDNQTVASAVADAVGIDEAWGDLMPSEKVDAVKRLRQEGNVAMVGDGVNDAPAMAHATVAVAMGAAGSDVALETADVALMSDNLSHLPFAIGLSRMTNRIIKQNLWISLGMVAFLVPATILGLQMGPAVVLHEGSTLVVVVNALRLLGYKAPD